MYLPLSVRRAVRGSVGAPGPRPIPARRALLSSSSSSSSRQPPLTTGLALDSPSFPTLRARRNAYVDKTSAIADLLVSDEGMFNQTRAFFTRPRKFGKSLTLDVAAEMLAAGALPAGVAPWPGYEPVDVDAVFGGLAVHVRWRARDQALHGLLERAHFVVKLGLGEAQTGASLAGTVIARVARIAGSAFGSDLKAEVAAAHSPGDALEALVDAVPRGVPIALLVDEYDGAIIQDVAEGDWAAAKAGLKALRSLLMATKVPDVGARIERCLVTGVARFAHTSLFSGANNFADLTDDPLLSRVLGFSEGEIRTTFPAELARLAAATKTSEDEVVAELARWYNGYCFDGASSCFNPFPVLKALRAGAISERELEGASGTNWLGLAPRDVVAGLSQELQAGARAEAMSIDIADLEARRVRVVPLLLQTGLLSVIAGTPARCRPPNEYARRSLQRMVETAIEVPPAAILPLAAALSSRDRAAFTAMALLLVAKTPRTIYKKAPDGAEHLSRESIYHGVLFGALVAAAPPGVDVIVEASVNVGVADIVVKFAGEQPAAWILEVGIFGGRDSQAQQQKKAAQAQSYASAFAESELFCCGMVVQPVPSASHTGKGAAVLTCAWTQRQIESDGTVTWKEA